MLASFIIGFHTERFDNLLQTLRFLTENHSEVTKESQLITLCQNDLLEKPVPGTGQFFAHSESFKRFDHFDLKLSCMQLPYVTNFGVKRSVSERLIILESDRILPKGYFADVLIQLQPGVQITTKKMRKLKKEATDQEIKADAYEYDNEDRNEQNEPGFRNMWSGNTAICKSDFYAAGAMDETYTGYGWADSDMTFRTQAAGIKSIFRPETELHLWHPGMTYGDGNQKEMFIANGQRFCKKWNIPLPNWFKREILLEEGLI